MSKLEAIGLTHNQAICYSGYRDGQVPGISYPSYEEVKEDLLILENYWKYLRLYNCDQHTETVLEVIQKEGLDFTVMVGAYVVGEMNNFNCPWGGGIYTPPQIEENIVKNNQLITRLIELANQYPKIISSLSVGNECCVDWTDHYVHEDRVVEFVKRVQSDAAQPVTFCENYVPWLYKLEKVAEVVDFICIHTYPVWEYKHINEALDYTKDNYYAVANKYPEKEVVIAEAGWATQSNGKGIDPANVSEEYQQQYFQMLTEWTNKEKILTFFFEAFDESWKGSPEPLEPEKHWGVFKIDRTPKLAANDLNAVNLI